MLIIPSKQLLLISAQQSKQIFLFDPKTNAVLTKYHCDSNLAKSIAYYPQANQFLTTFNNKTFINFWSTDTQQPLSKISTSDLISFMCLSNDNNLLYVGSNNGNLYIWQLPTGVLLCKKSIHSGQIKKIIEYRSGFLMTASKQQLKMWSLASFLIETQRSTPIKTITSVLDIIQVQYVRNIFFVLTNKSLTCYLGGNQYNNSFPQIHKEDYQYPTTLCVSLGYYYVGDFQGIIHGTEISTLMGPNDRSHHNYELDFKYNDKNQSIQIDKAARKPILQNKASKNSIVTLRHLKTLSYLISGNSEGDIFIWQNHTLKKSLKLFKSSIKFIMNIPRPSEQKVVQKLKLRPLAKFQQNKQTEPLEVDISYLTHPSSIHIFEQKQETEKSLFQSLEYIGHEAEQQLILDRMLDVLNRPQTLLKQKISQLEQENQLLFKANLQYCEKWNHSEEQG